MFRFTPIGQNIWAVKRDGIKVAEVALRLDGVVTLIPEPTRCFELEHLASILEWMRELQNEDSAVVLRMGA